MKRATTAGLLIATAIALSGCLGSTAPVPADNYYRMIVADDGAAPARPTLPGILVVSAFDGDGLLRDRPILFADAAEPHQVRQHNYHYWSDPPTRMIQGEMVEFLRRHGLADSVVTPDMQINADYELQGRVKRLERLIGGGRPGVAVEIEIALIRLRDQKLLLSKTYTSKPASNDETVVASVRSMNEALTDIFERFSADASRSFQASLR